MEMKPLSVIVVLLSLLCLGVGFVLELGYGLSYPHIVPRWVDMVWTIGVYSCGVLIVIVFLYGVSNFIYWLER